jgi:hypothetical protein
MISWWLVNIEAWVHSYVEFVVQKVALGHVFISPLWISSPCSHFTKAMYSSIISTWNNTPTESTAPQYSVSPDSHNYSDKNSVLVEHET